MPNIEEDLDLVYQRLLNDKQYLNNLTAVERSLARLGLDYGSDGRDLLIPHPLGALPAAAKIRVRPKTLEVSAALLSSPPEYLLGELYYYTYKHPTEAVFFYLSPDNDYNESLTVAVRLPFTTHKPRLLAEQLRQALLHMSAAYLKLTNGDYGRSGKEVFEKHAKSDDSPVQSEKGEENG